MDIFNSLIKKTEALLPYDRRTYEYTSARTAMEGRENELILGRDAAYELGGGSFPSVSYTLFTEDKALVPQDEVVVYGNDLGEISADCAFARIAIIRTDFIEENGEQGAYAIIENIGLKKYDVFPKGYMVRTSALSSREQVRVAKTAIGHGISFEAIGNLFIKKYKENKHVQSVKLIFVTLPDAPYTELENLAITSIKMIKALNHIIADLKMDCKRCEWKPVCDEVEGMKEIHFKMAEHK